MNSEASKTKIMIGDKEIHYLMETQIWDPEMKHKQAIITPPHELLKGKRRQLVDIDKQLFVIFGKEPVKAELFLWKDDEFLDFKDVLHQKVMLDKTIEYYNLYVEWQEGYASYSFKTKNMYE